MYASSGLEADLNEASESVSVAAGAMRGGRPFGLRSGPPREPCIRASSNKVNVALISYIIQAATHAHSHGVSNAYAQVRLSSPAILLI